jgi:ribosome-associated heat shock protein Hsp15
LPEWSSGKRDISKPDFFKENMTEPLVARTVRLDVWLWAARFYKTRVLAKDAVALGKVEIGGQRAKPARAVRVGDVLQVQRGDERFEVTVLGLSDVRGPAPVAQALYGESEASQQRRAQVRATRAAERSGYRAPQTKPDKRARRLIQALGDIDAL